MKKRNLTINVDNWIEFNKEHLFRNMHNFLKLTQWHECVKELYGTVHYLTLMSMCKTGISIS